MINLFFGTLYKTGDEPMNIAVVDDNRQESALLTRFLHQYEEKYGFNMTISCFPDGEDLIASLRKTDYMIVFLDIFMEHMNGIETAKKLWESDPQCLIIFLTVSQEHIWQAANLHCFDYIDKKELTKERIFHVLSDIRRRLPAIHQTLDFFSGSQQIQLPIHRIQHILSDNNYTIFKMTDGTEYRYRVSFRNISELTECTGGFLNCNRGILLNMDYIIQEEADVYVMENGQRFPIRRADRTFIKNTYHNYQFEKLERM